MWFIASSIFWLLMISWPSTNLRIMIPRNQPHQKMSSLWLTLPLIGYPYFPFFSLDRSSLPTLLWRTYFFPYLHPSLLTDISYFCTITPSNFSASSQPQSQSQLQTSGNFWSSFPIHTIPFLFPPSSIVSKLVMATLNFMSFTLGILVWYLDPPTSPPTH